MLSSAGSARMLTDAEAAQVSQRFPALGVRPGGISQVRDDLLDRLFRKTAFYRILDRSGRPPHPYLISISGDSVLPMPGGFNLLLREQNMEVTDDNILDLARAFVILATDNEPLSIQIDEFSPLDSIPRITFLGGQRIEQRDLRYPYAVDAKITCRVGSGETQTWDFFQARDKPSKGVWVKVGQFDAVRVSTGGKPLRQYFPVTTKEETRTGAATGAEWIEIDIAIGNVTVEQDENLNSHYYLRSSRNGVPTDHFVGFRLHGFEPGEENVYVKVAPTPPFTTYGPDTLLGPVDIGPSGEGVCFWMPPFETETGIALVCAGVKPPGDTFSRLTHVDKELTVEKIVVDTFPGVTDDSLTIYYCNQSFANIYQEPVIHPAVFARYVDTAMMNAWRTQAGTWGLGTPPDVDRNHQVFVNDGEHWYHSYPDIARADSGPNRKIALRSWIWYCRSVDKAYSNESIRVQVVLAHEFYHGIQYGRDPAKFDNDDWNWFTEGQARFMQSAMYPDEEFDTSSTWGKRQYARDANKYLTAYLNTSLSSLSIDDSIRGYPYCLFWRFLYENFGRDSGGVQLVKDCYAANVGTNNSIGRGKAAIDAGITKWMRDHGGNVVPGYQSFLQSLDQFAVACYLNDTSFHLWYDSNDVYVPCSLTANHTFQLGPTETDSFCDTNNVPCSFGIDQIQLVLNGNVDTVRVTLDRRCSGPLSARLVKVYTPGHIVRYRVVPAIDSTPDSSATWNAFQLCTEGAEQACLVVTRQDTVDDTCGNYIARFKVNRAVADSELLPATDTVIAGTEFTPRTVVVNHGWMTEKFPAFLSILRDSTVVHADTDTVTLRAGAVDTVVFDSWRTAKGSYTTCCSVYIASDTTRGDDVKRGTLVALADTWQERPLLPETARHFCQLAAVGDTLIYALRGEDTKDFYCYDVRSRTWDTLESTPYVIREGSALTWDRGGHLYALRGCICEPTRSFYHSELLRYSIAANTWTAETVTLSGTLVKFGPSSDLVWGGDGCLYALLGGWCEAWDTLRSEKDSARIFLRCNVASHQWRRLDNVLGECIWEPSLCWDQHGHIYALCANNSDTFCRYDIVGGGWSLATPFPVSCEWSALAYNELDGGIYGMAGYIDPGVALMFCRYDTAGGTWSECASPTHSEFRYADALATCGGFVYNLKGSWYPPYQDFSRYAPSLPTGGTRLASVSNGPANSLAVASNRLQVSPNPARRAACVEWQVTEPGPVMLRVFDNVGRVVRTIQNGYQVAGRHTARWDGVCDNGRQAPAGVYFWRIDTPGFHKIVKVVTVGK